MDCGLFPTINLILGIPESTPEELLTTIRQAMGYIDKPCQLSIAHRMHSFPGAPIWGRKGYSTSFHTWTHPSTNETMKIPYYFIPEDERMASLIDQLEHGSFAILEEMRTAANWENSLSSREWQ